MDNENGKNIFYLDLNGANANNKMATKTGMEASIRSSSNCSADECCSSSLKERKNGLSYAEILVNFLKGMIGPGCLSLPLAFKQAGLWTGLALVFIFGFLNCICMIKLVKCSHLLSNRRGNSFLNYGNMAYEAISGSFHPIRPFARAAKIFVNASIVSLQMGVCSVFYVFCGVHIKEFFDEFLLASSDPSNRPSAIDWMLLLFLPFVLINFVRNLRPIAVLSSIGNFLCVCSLLFIFQHLLRHENHTFNLPWFTNFNGVMTACGSILYSFEGQAMVLPLENRLKHPKQILGPFGILSVGITIVSMVYASSGFFGYISYGQSVRGSITLNLPQQEFQFSLLRLALTLVIYFGFVIQMYVIVDMLWPDVWKCLERRGKFANAKMPIELAFRTFLVAISMTFAIAVPNLEQMIPIVGVTTGMLLAFIIPAILDLLTWLPIHIERGNKCGALLILLEDLFLTGVGLFGLIAGLQANLSTLFDP